MAETKKAKAEETKVEETKVEDREDIFIPKGITGEDPNLFVSINGKNFLLPKGKKSNVPSYVAKEIRRSWEAQALGDKTNNQLLEMGKEPVYRI